MKLWKKSLSVLLSVLLVIGTVGAMTAFAAAEERSVNPIVYLGGNGEIIVDRNNNEAQVYDLQISSEQIQTIVQRVIPLLFSGYVTGNFDAYYKAFGEEFTKIYDKARLQPDGTPQEGITIPKHSEDVTNWSKNVDLISNGSYGTRTYEFHYDWRLSSFTNAEKLAEYVRGVYNATGKKVNLMTRCLGSNVVLTYLAKYPDDVRAYVANVGIDAGTGTGCEMLENIYTGNIKIDGVAGARYLDGEDGTSFFEQEQLYIYEFLRETLDFLNEFYVADAVTEFFMKNVYDVLAEGLLQELIIASYGTWVGYWSMVSPANLELALKNVFGPEGSENRRVYAPIIEQIRQYNDEVAVHQSEILQAAKADGVNFVILSKYGYQMNFYCGDSEKLSDRWVSVEYSSFGATTAEVTTTLSEEYIAQATEKGTDKYIGIDRKIDASTCEFPDTTWFLKGCRHDNWTTEEENLIVKFFNANGAMNVFSDENYPQYMIVTSDESDALLLPMTLENMNADSFDIPEAEGKTNKAIEFLRRLADFLRYINSLIRFAFDYLANR